MKHSTCVDTVTHTFVYVRFVKFLAPRLLCIVLNEKIIISTIFDINQCSSNVTINTLTLLLILYYSSFTHHNHKSNGHVFVQHNQYISFHTHVLWSIYQRLCTIFSIIIINILCIIFFFIYYYYCCLYIAQNTILHYKSTQHTYIHTYICWKKKTSETQKCIDLFT